MAETMTEQMKALVKADDEAWKALRQALVDLRVVVDRQLKAASACRLAGIDPAGRAWVPELLRFLEAEWALLDKFPNGSKPHVIDPVTAARDDAAIDAETKFRQFKSLVDLSRDPKQSSSAVVGIEGHLMNSAEVVEAALLKAKRLGIEPDVDRKTLAELKRWVSKRQRDREAMLASESRAAEPVAAEPVAADPAMVALYGVDA
jgi:hypothetical protein